MALSAICLTVGDSLLPDSQYSSVSYVIVRLGNSGLKVSRIILGCMTYGDVRWQPWALDKKARIEHIKAAYDAGINAFDTANVRQRSFLYSFGR
jgi:hypothetical protein